MAKRARVKRNSQQFQENDDRSSGVGGRKSSGNKNCKKHSKGGRRSRRESADVVELHPHQNIDTAYSPRQDNEPLRARTESQETYIQAIKRNCLTFGIGPAGTGKSYCAGAIAAEALQSGQIERIILTRPAVESGESLGFLPGDINEKYAVYIDAFRDILNERLGAGTVNYLLRHGRIVAAPLAFMRGKTFREDTFVILDEAQNTSPAQMKMFLTRIGENCKVVINGDVKQSDIKGPNGLSDSIRRLQGLPSVYVHEFTREDIVRSGLVQAVIDRYEVNGA